MNSPGAGAIATLACALALVIAASSFAAVPREGSFLDGSSRRNGGTRVVFKIDGGNLKDFTASSRRCGAAVRETIGVSDSGRFRYRGKARDLGGPGPAGPGSGPITRGDNDTRVEISGKFVSGSKAKGTVSQNGCGTVRFVAKRRNIKHPARSFG